MANEEKFKAKRRAVAIMKNKKKAIKDNSKRFAGAWRGAGTTKRGTPKSTFVYKYDDAANNRVDKAQDRSDKVNNYSPGRTPLINKANRNPNVVGRWSK